MKNFHKILIFIHISALIFSCSNTNSSDKEKEVYYLGKLINSGAAGTVVAGTTTDPQITCSDSAPSFSTLSAAGTGTNCASCHNSSSPEAGVDITSRTNLLNVVISGDPVNSTLYRMISVGKMKVYTTSAITTAVYCWIKGGALP